MMVKIFKVLTMCFLFTISKNTLAQQTPTKVEGLPTGKFSIVGGKIKNTSDALKCSSPNMEWTAGWHPSYTYTLDVSTSPLIIRIKPEQVWANMRFQLKNCNTANQKKNQRIDQVNFKINPVNNKADSRKPTTSFNVVTLQNGNRVITINNALAEIFFTGWGSWRWNVLGNVVITLPKPGTTGTGRMSLNSLKTYCAVNPYSQCVQITSSNQNNWPTPNSALGDIITASVDFKVSCNSTICWF